MGQVLGRLNLMERELTVKLEFERQDLAEKTEAFLKDLTSSLELKGFTVRKITCLARTPLELRQEGSQEFGLSYEGKIDFKV